MRTIDKLNTKRIVSTWRPIIDTTLNKKNNDLIELICLYCHWQTLVEQNKAIVNDVLNGIEGESIIPDKLLKIKNKVDSFDRIEIVGKFFNPYSGIVEHKLSNGKYISEKGNEY